MRSLEKRWKDSDQDLFIVATILNPFVGRKQLCFSTSIESWKNHGLYKLIKEVYQRIFEREPPAELFEEWMEYKQSQGAFSDDALAITEYQKIAERRKESPNPMDIWSHIETPGCLSELALHLFQALPNSAAVERLFIIWILRKQTVENHKKPRILHA